MGRRGPKPKSAERESAQGFPGRRKKKTPSQHVARKQSETPAEDSAFVPPHPPHYLRRKSERDIWRELTEDPARQLWFKRSDHNLIARYCDLENRRRKLAAKSLPETYTTTNTNGDRVIKPNPAWTAYARLCQLLIQIEAQIGGSPLARLNVASKMGTIGDAPAGRTAASRAGQPAASATPASPSAPTSSPLGVLKTATPPPGTKPN